MFKPTLSSIFDSKYLFLKHFAVMNLVLEQQTELLSQEIAYRPKVQSLCSDNTRLTEVSWLLMQIQGDNTYARSPSSMQTVA